MNEQPLLLPVPRQTRLGDGWYDLGQRPLLLIDSPDPAELLFSARRLVTAAAEEAGVRWEINAGTGVPQNLVAAQLSAFPGATPHEQGYQLTISASGISALAATSAGLFYAACTLIQLMSQYGRRLPFMRLNDWPDYRQRGVLLDISRDRVPTMAALFELIDLFASWKINQLQLYTEHTFAYQRHPVVWAGASPLTGDEILALDTYCRERFIELVPNQNSFGHLRRWLIHDEYRHLAEASEGCDTVWGYFAEPFSLCPEDPGSLILVRSLFDELLPHFSSRQVNVGCDETVDLGQGRSAAAVKARGIGRVYLDFLLAIYHDMKARGKTMQFWGDIIVTHPELVPELPRDAVALEWGYEKDHPFTQHSALFAAAGISFYVCPGTSSWNSISGRTANALENLRHAARSGLEHGAVGYLITDWGDNGHWQPLPASYLGFGYGAALAWSLEANENLPLNTAVSAFACDDKTGRLGTFLDELGHSDQLINAAVHNGTLLFWLLQKGPGELEELRKLITHGSLKAGDLARTLEALAEIRQRLAAMEVDGQRAALVLRELHWTTDVLMHSCRRGIWMLELEQGLDSAQLRQSLSGEAQGLIAEYGELWQVRSRPGGFADSVRRLEKMRADYDM